MREQMRVGRAVVNEETALFEVLRRRHACRNFDRRPIPDQALRKLAYAAHRAPTAGNAAYRFIVILKDSVQLKMLKLVSPGYLGEAPAAIVVCTDLRVAFRGHEGKSEVSCAQYDAGAAAENVVLAAYSMGLAGLFIKSYSEAALSRILDLPDGCRTELVILVGYPAKDEPKPLRKRAQGKVTFLDRYGSGWMQKTK